MSRSALNVRNLRKTYKDVVAVDGLELEVRAGECFGLLGPNGAGKTTTVEICEGITRADFGEIELLGMNWDAHARQLRQRLGIQLQETQLSDKLTVFEVVRLFRSFFGKGRSPQPSSVSCSLGRNVTRAWAGSQAGRSSGWRWRARWWEIRSFCF